MGLKLLHSASDLRLRPTNIARSLTQELDTFYFYRYGTGEGSKSTKGTMKDREEEEIGVMNTLNMRGEWGLLREGESYKKRVGGWATRVEGGAIKTSVIKMS